MDVTFKFDEEFEYYDAYLKEKVKCIASKNNNRMKMLTHSSHGCWETKVTAGNDFMVVVSTFLRILQKKIHFIF